MTVFDGPIAPGDGTCSTGIRSGKKAPLFTGPWTGKPQHFTYSTTSANPKIAPSSIGQGWTEASKSQRKAIKKNLGFVPTGQGICGA